MRTIFPVSCLVLLVWTCDASDQLDAITDSLFREVMSRMSGPEDALVAELDDFNLPHKDYPARAFEARRDAILGREPSIRDQEYLQHSSLYGQKYMQGGAGEGFQRLKPDGSMRNVQIVKTDSLPAFCNPANPCPLGYVADDGCLEDFENTAAFSRAYEAAQDCMCDTEHMFDCPGATRENEIDALARSFENEGLAESTINRLLEDITDGNSHKVVAKKFFSAKAPSKDVNPFLEGEKLPVVAKKTPI